MLCYRGDQLQSIMLCPFWAFVPVALFEFASCAISFTVTHWMFITLLLMYVFLFCLSLLALHQLQRLPQCWQSPVSLWVPLPDGVVTTTAMPHHWVFYIQGSRFSSHDVAPDLVLCARCILHCKNCRLLHWCCVKWLFQYPVRQLCYIWTIVLLKLIHVI